MDLSRIPLQQATLWKEVEDSLYADLLFSIVEIAERGYENKNRGGIIGHQHKRVRVG